MYGVLKASNAIGLDQEIVYESAVLSIVRISSTAKAAGKVLASRVDMRLTRPPQQTEAKPGQC